MNISYFEDRLTKIQEHMTKLRDAKDNGWSGSALDYLGKALHRESVVYQSVVAHFYQQ